MDTIFTFISMNVKLLLIYLAIWLVTSVLFYFLAKNLTARNKVLNGLLLVQNLLESKLGEKSSAILQIWIEGLNKIQDGEFSNEDGVDQFVRYVRLAVKNYGIDLTERDLDILHTIVMSTLNIFVKSKPKQIESSIQKFNTIQHLSKMNKI